MRKSIKCKQTLSFLAHATSVILLVKCGAAHAAKETMNHPKDHRFKDNRFIEGFNYVDAHRPCGAGPFHDKSGHSHML